MERVGLVRQAEALHQLWAGHDNIAKGQNTPRHHEDGVDVALRVGAIVHESRLYVGGSFTPLEHGVPQVLTECIDASGAAFGGRPMAAAAAAAIEASPGLDPAVNLTVLIETNAVVGIRQDG
jgi:hypothetical protein